MERLEALLSSSLINSSLKNKKKKKKKNIYIYKKKKKKKKKKKNRIFISIQIKYINTENFDFFVLIINNNFS